MFIVHSVCIGALLRCGGNYVRGILDLPLLKAPHQSLYFSSLCLPFLIKFLAPRMNSTEPDPRWYSAAAVAYWTTEPGRGERSDPGPRGCRHRDAGRGVIISRRSRKAAHVEAAPGNRIMTKLCAVTRGGALFPGEVHLVAYQKSAGGCRFGQTCSPRA